MPTTETPIPGCVEIRPPVHRDARGTFAKPYAAGRLPGTWAAGGWEEGFWTASNRGVIRGFHLQLPPHEYDKLVFCAHGEVFDALLDLRRGSPAFGTPHTLALSAAAGNALFIPAGVAHAFQAVTEDAVLVYLVSAAHDAAHDAGVRWDSAGVAWPLPPGAISPRDAALPPFAAFESPFRFPVPASR